MQKDAVLQSVEQARAGDEQALAGLIASFMPAVRAASVRCACPGLEYEDAVQEGIIALFHAIQTYDAAKGAGFSTYAGACIQNAAVSAARAAGRRKHAPLNHSVPLSEEALTPGPEELVLASEQSRSAMRRISTRLSPMERQVLTLFLDGCAYSAIAKRLDVSEKAVDNALQRVRAKLRCL